MTAATLLRPGALDGRGVVAGGAYAAACAAAGATIADRAAARVDVLVVDAAVAFGGGGLSGLRAALDGAWRDVLEVASGRWLAEGAGADAGGLIVLVGPRAGTGEHAEAATAALENLARTLAVEWARFGVRAVAVARGPRTSDEEVAQLVAYLASAAGAYYSGCRFELR
jgi:NAD(P)-dependent dehydrogenase (short-subunit alcohol dehydrogenase family)